MRWRRARTRLAQSERRYVDPDLSPGRFGRPPRPEHAPAVRAGEQSVGQGFRATCASAGSTRPRGMLVAEPKARCCRWPERRYFTSQSNSTRRFGRSRQHAGAVPQAPHAGRLGDSLMGRCSARFLFRKDLFGAMRGSDSDHFEARPRWSDWGHSSLRTESRMNPCPAAGGLADQRVAEPGGAALAVAAAGALARICSRRGRRGVLAELHAGDADHRPLLATLAVDGFCGHRPSCCLRLTVMAALVGLLIGLHGVGRRLGRVRPSCRRLSPRRREPGHEGPAHGASGFVGATWRWRWTAQGHVVRSVSRRHGIDMSRMLSPADWLPHLDAIDAVVNAVGIIGETRHQRFDLLHTRAPVALFGACRQAGVRRVVQISALGATRRRSPPTT